MLPDRDSGQTGRLLTGLVLSAVVVASVVNPGPAVGTQMGPLGVLGADVWMHTLAYALLAVVIESALGLHLALAAVAAVGVGVGLELVQTALPYRHGSLADVVANGAGAALGAVVCVLRARWRA